MSGPHAAVADQAMSNIRGCQDAQHLLQRIRQGCAPADALHDDLLEVKATGDAARFRGFCREIQKAVERAVERAA